MKKIVIGTLGLFASFAIPAQAEQMHFSAEAIMKAPNAAEQHGHLYIGKAGTRFDTVENGRKVSKIQLPAQGLARIIFEDSKEYLEFKLPAQTNTAISQATEPCKTTPHVTCKKIGDEDFKSMKVERWTVLPKGEKNPIKILWDKSRKMMVSQVFPNGMSIINSLIGKEKYENIDIERWETAYKSTDGKILKGTVLYAPKLEIAVLEKQPNGMVKELHKIKVSEPNDTLFTVPAGFKKLTSPPASTGSMKK